MFAVAVAEGIVVAALFALAVAVGCAIVAGTIDGIVVGIAGIVGMFVPVVVVVVAGLLLEKARPGMLGAGVVVGMLVHNKLVGMLVHKLVGMFVAVVAGSIGAAVVVLEAGMPLMSLLQSCSEASYTLTCPLH